MSLRGPKARGNLLVQVEVQKCSKKDRSTIKISLYYTTKIEIITTFYREIATGFRPSQ